jgi:hypothetical protein
LVPVSPVSSAIVDSFSLTMKSPLASKVPVL